MKSVLKSGLTLAIIVLVCGALLVGVYKLTYVPYVFSLTSQDNAAISEMTSSTKFGLIDVESPSVRYVLRVLDGEDKDNYIIRAVADGPRGIAETGLLIDGESGAIKDIKLINIDRGAHNYLSRVDLDKTFARYIGKTSLGSFDKTADGVSGVTETNLALYTSINNGLNMYASNASAIKSATVSREVSLGAVLDKMLEAIQVLFPTTSSYEEVLAEEQPGAYGQLQLTGYLTDEGNIVILIYGWIDYDQSSGSPYQAGLLFKFNEENKADSSPVELDMEAMQSYYEDAIAFYKESPTSDGRGSGATGTFTFIKQAFAYANYFIPKVQAEVATMEVVPTSLEVAYE